MAGQRIRDLLSAMAYEDGLFYCEDPSLAFSFICSPLTSTTDEAERGLQVLLNKRWPTDTALSFMLFGNPDVQQPLRQMMQLRTGDSPLFAEMSRRSHDFLMSSVDQPFNSMTDLRLRDMQLVITIKIPIANMEPTEEERKEIQQLLQSTKTQLDTIGFNPVVMDENAWLRMMTVIFNMGKDATWRRSGVDIEADEEEPLRDQITEFPSAIKVKHNGLQIGDETHVAVLSVKRWPKKSIFGMAHHYVGDSFKGFSGIRHPFILTGTVHFGDPVKKKTKLNRKFSMINHQAYGPLLKFLPVLATKKRHVDEMQAALDGGDRPVMFNLTMILFGQSEVDLVQAVANAETYWGGLTFGLMRDRFICLTLFINALPLCFDKAVMRDTFRHKTMATRHALTLLPIAGDWKGTGTPLLTFVSRNGQIMAVSPFDAATNYNVVVAASSGAGKSVLANNTIESTLATGGRVFIIDVGRSYEKQTALYGGDFLCFANDNDICLNPFQLIREGDDEEDFTLQTDMLAGLIEAMAAPTEKLSDFQREWVKRVMTECWAETGTDTLVDHIATKLFAYGKERDDRRISDISDQLYSFTSKGQYGRYFNGKNNVSFQKSLTVLELEELKHRPHLQQVVLLLLIWQIQDSMYLGDKNQRKIVLIDEAWELLREGNVAKFIENGYRRARKYNGSMWTITQSVLDLTSDVGQAIRANSANMYLLRQKGDVVEKLRKTRELELGEGGYDWLKTVHTVKDSYSEILFITEGRGGGIGRLIVDPFRLMIYTTNAEQVEAINRYRADGDDITEAIQKVLGNGTTRTLDAGQISRLLQQADNNDIARIEDFRKQKMSFEQAVAMVMGDRRNAA
jgi:conjugal transfer ATP-binding protein TraC